MGPVHQFVDAAVGVDEGAGLQVAPGLHPVATHGVDDGLGEGTEHTEVPALGGSVG